MTKSRNVGKGRQHGHAASYLGAEDILNAQEELFLHKLVFGNFASKQAAALAAGYNEASASVMARHILSKRSARRYLADLREEAGVKAVDVLRVLGKQMFNSLEDFRDPITGEISLRIGAQNGVLDQVKKVTFQDIGDGLKSLELYSSQTAAQTLAKCLGIEKSPETHPNDVIRQQQERERAMKQFNDLIEMGMTPKEAAELVISASNGAARPYLAEHTESRMVN